MRFILPHACKTCCGTLRIFRGVNLLDEESALFQDPWARKLAGPEGETMLKTIPKARQMAWPMIVRTHVMDELILRAVQDDGVDTVLNLASGLDARPYRLPLPESLRWIEADFADVLAYKQEVLKTEKPCCTVEFAPADLTRDDARAELLSRIGASAKRVFIISEGLLVYLQPEQVAKLATDLGRQASFHWWLIDLASPDLLKRLKKQWGKAMEKSPMIFGPEESTKFFAPYGWIEKEYRNTFDESFRLKRTMSMAGFFKFLGRFSSKKTQERFKRFSGIVLLEKK
jgi:methyltransferase (TIGR00027 family)